MSNPALYLPVSDRGWPDVYHQRINFIELMLPKLQDLGWTYGVDFKSLSLPIDGWEARCAERVVEKGGRLVWHPANFKLAYGIGKGKLTDVLRQVGEDAFHFCEKYPLEALVIHPDALQYGEPEAEVGIERYNSKVTAAQVLRAIRNHIQPLKELNEICGGILHIENVHNCLFSGRNENGLPLYEAMQLGYLELPWVAEQAGIQTVMDSVHFFGAYNFYQRQRDFKELYHTHKWHWTRAQNELSKLAGYLVKKGYPVIGTRDISFEEFLPKLKSNLFHIGGPQQLSQDGTVVCHHETDTNDLVQKQILLLELDYIMKHHCLGAVVEVEGMVGMFKFSERSMDDSIAKMRECLTIIDAIEKLQTGIWQVDPST